MTRPYRFTGIVRNHHHHQHEKEPVMKAEKKETTCLLDVAGKGSVKTSVQVPVKDITVHKPVIKGGKGKKKLPVGCRKEKCSCKRKSLFLEDGKVRGISALFNMALTLKKTPWSERKASWMME